MYVDGSYVKCCKTIDELMRDAESGDPEALYIIGRRLDEGDGLKQDRDRGIDYMIKSAESGYAPAQNYLGYLYNHGDYFKKDTLKAKEWLTKAAEQGLPKAKYNLALFYKNGEKGTDKDLGLYFKLICEAAEMGYPYAQFELGEAYYFGNGTVTDYSQAFVWYSRAAEQCNANAEYSLGYLYEHGYGVKEDLKEAYKWYYDASTKGNDKATMRLGTLLFYKFSNRDSEAIEYIEQAADNGHSNACYALYQIYNDDEEHKDEKKARYWLLRGVSYRNKYCIKEAAGHYLSGSLLPYNPQLAVECYEAGIEDNNRDCMYLLGDLYDVGMYVKKDEEKALDLFRRAADKGECRAQCRLGDHYMYGTYKDPDMALYWYRLAACNDNVRAMKEMARIYEEGRIVTPSKSRALHWYNKVYSNKDELVAEDLDRMLRSYNPLEEEAEEQPLEKLKRLAIEDCDSKACFELGERYMNGYDGMTRDLYKARLWFELGYVMEDADCTDKLGYMYYVGAGVEKDPKKAVSYFRESAELGSPYSQMMLGYMYRCGKDLEKDEEEADRWLRRAKDQGYRREIADLFNDTISLTEDVEDILSEWDRIERLKEYGKN